MICPLHSRSAQTPRADFVRTTFSPSSSVVRSFRRAGSLVGARCRLIKLLFLQKGWAVMLSTHSLQPSWMQCTPLTFPSQESLCRYTARRARHLAGPQRKSFSKRHEHPRRPGARATAGCSPARGISEFGWISSSSFCVDSEVSNNIHLHGTLCTTGSSFPLQQGTLRYHFVVVDLFFLCKPYVTRVQ